MTFGCTTTVLSERRIPGVTIQMVENHWDAGARILDNDPDVLVRWRKYPYRIKARGWIEPGEMSNFGQLMLRPANMATHALAGDESEEVQLLLCRFDLDWLNSVTGQEHDWSDAEAQSCMDLRDANIDHAMRRLAVELVEPGLASNALTEALSISIAIGLARFFSASSRSGSSEVPGRLSNKRLRQIRDYVYSFNEGSPTLTDVARECGLSAAHLRRMYRNTTGQTLHDFIEDVRIARSQALLIDTNLSLKVISYRLGFCHPSAFSFAFKRATGEAPREYRQRCENGVAARC